MKSIYNQIWISAVRFISIRFMSRYDLMKKLNNKYPDEKGLIEDILDEMERVELLNDKRYIEHFVPHLIQKNIGRIKIMIESRKRGLDKHDISSSLQNFGYNEEKSAKLAFEAKNKTIHEADSRKRKQKLMNFLRGKGFTNAVIWKLLNAEN